MYAVIIINNIFRFAIEACNNVGKSKIERIKCQTLTPPPNPPYLTLVNATANTLKLKWSNEQKPTNLLNYYYLEKENENGSFSPVYEGELQTIKVKALKERAYYNFRIRAASSRNMMIGAWSKTFTFRTLRQPPSALKNPPTISEVGVGLYQIEWLETRFVNEQQQPLQQNYSMQLIYRLQVSKKIYVTIDLDGYKT